MPEIVEVRFIKDTQSVQTGNEFYAAGMTAHFFDHQTDVLVAQGRAVLSDDEPPIVKHTPPPAPVVLRKKPYSEMTVKVLRTEAEIAGIPFAYKMRKADLIAALEDKNG